MRTTIASGLVLLAMLLWSNVPNAHAQDERKVPPPQEMDKDDVALSLIYEYSPMSRRGTLAGKPSITPRLVVWNDGRILFGTGPERDRGEWKYYFGKVDPKKIEEMQKHIRSAFRIAKKNQEIVDFGPDGSYYNLSVHTKEDITSIMSWEIFANASLTEHVLMDATKTTDGKPILLPEFYDIWKKVKAEVVLFGEDIADSKEAIPVDVVFEPARFSSSEFTVRDKTGKVLAVYPPKKRQP